MLSFVLRILYGIRQHAKNFGMKKSSVYRKMDGQKQLKGDEEMIDHLEESTNIVNSNKKLIAAVAANMILLIVLIIFSGVIPNNRYFLVGIFVLALSGSATLLYQIIRKI